MRLQWKELPIIMENKMKAKCNFLSAGEVNLEVAPVENEIVQPEAVKPVQEKVVVSPPIAREQTEDNTAPPVQKKVTPAPIDPVLKPAPTPVKRPQKIDPPPGPIIATTDGGPLAKAKGVLLVVAFVIGILFGKFVL
jgi:hypothetical protein